MWTDGEFRKWNKTRINIKQPIESGFWEIEPNVGRWESGSRKWSERTETEDRRSIQNYIRERERNRRDSW